MAQSYTLNATGVTKIATAGLNAGPGGWYLVFTANTNGNGTAWNGSAVIAQDRTAPGSVSRPIAAGSLTNVAYYNPSSGASVNAGTAITATGNWQVDATGYDLYIVNTQTTAGTTCTVTVIPASQLATEPIEGPVTAAGNVTRGTFGANIPDTGDYAFPGAVTFATKAVSTTALATPSALAATAFNAFASTVSGATLMGYGTTGDVTLKNRAGTTVAYVGPNTTKFWLAGDLAVGSSTFVVTATTGAVVASSDISTANNLQITTSTAALRMKGSAGVFSAINVSGADVMQFNPAEGGVKFSLSATQATFATPLAITGALTGVTSVTASLGMVSGTANYRAGATTSVTGATVIYSYLGGTGMILVTGNDGTNYFADLIIFGPGVAAQVVSAKTIAGSPAVRTYSDSAGSAVALAMASGTYSIKTVPLEAS